MTRPPLFRIADANLAPEPAVNGMKVHRPELGRRNPNFTKITKRITDAQSFHNALQVSAVKRFSHGLRAQASYTFARSIDDSSGINSQDYVNNVTYSSDYYDDRGLYASKGHPFEVILGFDWAGNLNTLPSRARTSGLESGEFEQSNTGRPGSLLRSQCLSVASGKHARQSGTEHADRAGLANSDVALDKVWRLRARDSSVARELFNLMNHPNFAVPAG